MIPVNTLCFFPTCQVRVVRFYQTAHSFRRPSALEANLALHHGNGDGRCSPFSYHKLRGGFTSNYVGYWIDYGRFFFLLCCHCINSRNLNMQLTFRLAKRPGESHMALDGKKNWLWSFWNWNIGAACGLVDGFLWRDWKMISGWSWHDAFKNSTLDWGLQPRYCPG